MNGNLTDSHVCRLGVVSDPFVPEADALDQQREVTPPAVAPDDEPQQPKQPKRALDYPSRIPWEASEADVLEQQQVLEDDDER
jgi:hypothetical protein